MAGYFRAGGTDVDPSSRLLPFSTRIRRGFTVLREDTSISTSDADSETTTGDANTDATATGQGRERVDAADTQEVNDLISRAREMEEVLSTETRLILDEQLG